MRPTGYTKVTKQGFSHAGLTACKLRKAGLFLVARGHILKAQEGSCCLNFVMW
ncbi:hypothetical protein C8J27_101657 [Rhodobacter aestuarii]|uniref:Uncharacterized protein n=1 Tax=Rhodobacter aestuarii TaxID=453582 RepID=A0A1N7P2X3_9RHOB|nr:hypothetical protein C8J27_101657 [Rhodobacter aestuarii]SIT04924.1 hypothetical protein SAMN05421580_10917 [Rhodobacter aestuarii]